MYWEKFYAVSYICCKGEMYPHRLLLKRINILAKAWKFFLIYTILALFFLFFNICNKTRKIIFVLKMVFQP
jgi:hypothetical protein